MPGQHMLSWSQPSRPPYTQLSGMGEGSRDEFPEEGMNEDTTQVGGLQEGQLAARRDFGSTVMRMVHGVGTGQLHSSCQPWCDR